MWYQSRYLWQNACSNLLYALVVVTHSMSRLQK